MVQNKTFDEVAIELFTRRGDAILVPFLSVSAGDWSPSPNCCHENVDRWIAEHPGTKAVRGWLIVDLSSDLQEAMFFDAHSVVELENGALVDITPRISSCFLFRFLGHASADNFDAFKKRARLQYPPH